MDATVVLAEIERLAEMKSWPIIGPVKGKYLVDTVRKYKVATVLEVGTLVGYSAILMAMNMPEDGCIDTIEINPRSAKLAGENIRQAGFTQRIHVNVGNALKVIPALKGPFDMVFLDAAKKEYLHYLRLAEPKLGGAGVVFADNVKIFAREMKDYLDYVRLSGKYRSRFIDVGFDGVEVSVKL